jgi:thiol-disulfide isomerase/thioredoxin
MDILSGENLTLETITSRATNVVMVISTSWCGPCNAMIPVFEALAKEFPKVNFVKIDVTEEVPKFISDLKVRAVPTIFFVKSGDVGVPVAGSKTIEEMRSLIVEMEK